MGLISSFTLIRTISLFHLTAAYLFLTAPRLIADQNVVFVLGESVRLPHVSSLDKPNDASAYIAVLLAFLGIADFTAASMSERPALEYWSSNVPVRLTFLFGLSVYIYLFKNDGMFGTYSIVGEAGPGETLRNSLIFAWAFFELTFWFWIYTSLRDDKRDHVRRLAEKMKAEEDRL